jgi:hypothetical protein
LKAPVPSDIALQNTFQYLEQYLINNPVDYPEDGHSRLGEIERQGVDELVRLGRMWFASEEERDAAILKQKGITQRKKEALCHGRDYVAMAPGAQRDLKDLHGVMADSVLRACGVPDPAAPLFQKARVDVLTLFNWEKHVDDFTAFVNDKVNDSSLRRYFSGAPPYEDTAREIRLGIVRSFAERICDDFSVALLGYFREDGNIAGATYLTNFSFWVDPVALMGPLVGDLCRTIRLPLPPEELASFPIECRPLVHFREYICQFLARPAREVAVVVTEYLKPFVGSFADAWDKRGAPGKSGGLKSLQKIGQRIRSAHHTMRRARERGWLPETNPA